MVSHIVDGATLSGPGANSLTLHGMKLPAHGHRSTGLRPAGETVAKLRKATARVMPSRAID